MRRINAIFLLLLLLVSSCNPFSKEVDLSKEIYSVVNDNRICLKDLSINKGWDSLYIVEPYRNIDDLKIDIDFISEGDIKSHMDFDNICTIIFANKGKLVAYSFVDRSVFDFAEATKVEYGRKETIVFRVKSKKIKLL